jgi:sugar phosphate isomerase/epimerase
MIHPGLTTATTRDLSVEQTLSIACECGLEGIEWEAQKHVPPGDFKAADNARSLCAAEKIIIPSYGSYYTAGVSEEAGMQFSAVLDAARALDAPAIRIWAGDQDYDKSDPTHINDVVRDTLRIADMAAGKGIILIFEFHAHSLTNTAEFAMEFSRKVEHPAVTFSWQPIQAFSQEECKRSLSKMLLSTLHVFHWDMGPYPDRGYTRERFIEEGISWFRHPLEQAVERWRSYLELANTTRKDHWAFLEFTKDDSTDQLLEDAKTLKSLIGAA